MKYDKIRIRNMPGIHESLDGGYAAAGSVSNWLELNGFKIECETDRPEDGWLYTDNTDWIVALGEDGGFVVTEFSPENLETARLRYWEAVGDSMLMDEED